MLSRPARRRKARDESDRRDRPVSRTGRPSQMTPADTEGIPRRRLTYAIVAGVEHGPQPIAKDVRNTDHDDNEESRNSDGPPLARR